MPTLVTRGAASVRGFGFAGTTPVLADPYFNYTTLLLHGNGTNGGQNNTFLDSSTNNFTITRNGNTTQGTFSPFSQTGWSNYFDGSGDYLTGPSNAAFAFGTGDLTVEFWLYTLSTPGVVAGIYDVGTTNTSGRFVIDYYSDQKVKIETAGSTIVASSTNLPLNSWVHIAAVRSGTTMSLYQNGTRVGTATNSTNFSQNSPWVGQSLDGYAYNGYISSLRAVKGTAVYDPTQTSITVPTAPLTNITNTSLLTCQSNRFIDNGTANSGSGFTLTVSGNTSVQAFSPFAPTAAYSASTVGGSGYFDGTGDYLSVGSNSNIPEGNEAFTVEAWVRINTTSQVDLFAWGEQTASKYTAATFNFGGTGNILFFWWSNDLQANGTNVSDGAWHHVAFTYDGTTRAIYLDGARVASDTPASHNVTVTNNLTIGYRPSGTAYAFNGYMSGFRIVSNAAIYSGTTYTVPTAPPTTTVSAGTVSLLLNFTNAAIIDNTAKNVLETVADAQISTTQSKFGGASLYFDGNGDYLIMPDAQTGQFLTGDFTVEYWCRFGSQGTNYAPQVGTLTSASPSGTWRFGTFTNNGGVYLAYHNGSTFVDVQFGSTAYNDNTWRHFALTRSGTTVRAFVDGTQVGTNQTVSQNFNSSNKVSVGAELLNPTYFNGYIDDLRITKGIARYTSAFTPPSAAFPLS